MKKIFIIILLLAVYFFFWKIPVNGIHYQTGSGKQTGYVSAVERSGLFWKTGTVYIKPTLESTQEDVYCVTNDAVLEQLSQASADKVNVTVSHISWLSSGAKYCNGESAVIIDFVNN